MNVIKFSHFYRKLLIHGIGFIPIDTATLLEVLYVRLESLHKEFLDYDTDNGTYQLPKGGTYLLLVFQKTDRDIFTTLRRCTPKKERYYRSKIGEVFCVEVSK